MNYLQGSALDLISLQMRLEQGTEPGDGEGGGEAKYAESNFYPFFHRLTWIDTFLSLPCVDARHGFRGMLCTGSGGPSRNI